MSDVLKNKISKNALVLKNKRAWYISLNRKTFLSFLLSNVVFNYFIVFYIILFNWTIWEKVGILGMGWKHWQLLELFRGVDVFSFSTFIHKEGQKHVVEAHISSLISLIIRNRGGTGFTWGGGQDFLGTKNHN